MDRIPYWSPKKKKKHILIWTQLPRWSTMHLHEHRNHRSRPVNRAERACSYTPSIGRNPLPASHAQHQRTRSQRAAMDRHCHLRASRSLRLRLYPQGGPRLLPQSTRSIPVTRLGLISPVSSSRGHRVAPVIGNIPRICQRAPVHIDPAVTGLPTIRHLYAYPSHP